MQKPPKHPDEDKICFCGHKHIDHFLNEYCDKCNCIQFNQAKPKKPD